MISMDQYSFVFSFKREEDTHPEQQAFNMAWILDFSVIIMHIYYISISLCDVM